ncbi:hypothetical protein GCWU000246_00383 [Jonquetella anthropi E3_33 E1]|nr:hypothetical protein GCWU000246_00383 [Jonquetella anthropi E3_33 E1]
MLSVSPSIQTPTNGQIGAGKNFRPGESSVIWRPETGLVTEQWPGEGLASWQAENELTTDRRADEPPPSWRAVDGSTNAP